MQPMTSSLNQANGGRLVDTRERALPLLTASLEAHAAGGIARVVFRQHFRNTHAEPLAVTYSLPLPSDAAVSGFAFVVGDRRIVGEVDRREAARERFEQAILDGHTAALLEQERSSLFTQEIGNIPPHTDVHAEIVLDLRLRWLDEGAWELRFPCTTAPRYLGAPGRVGDAAQVTQDIADGPIPARVTLSLEIGDQLVPTGRPASPSHRVTVGQAEAAWQVGLGDEGAALDRDVVVRWPVASLQPGASLSTARPASAVGEHDAFGLLTIVPPPRSAGPRPIARDLVVLLDTSGSMSGEPISQAVRVASALVDTLGPEDTVDLMAFSSSVQRWNRHPAPATPENKSAALAWLRALRASGGTEMREGILAALKTLRGNAQRQVVLVTDGLIGFEQEIVHAIATRLPEGSRVHTVGVGSAVNRTLTGGAARAGRGVEVIVGLGEDAEPAARRLVARTDAPLITALAVQGSALRAHAPERLPDLFVGAPALVGLELRPEGGDLTVHGHTADGAWEQHLRVPAVEQGAGISAIARLVARERVEDLEAQLAAGETRASIDARIEDLGVRFQIATRLTSWVAIDPLASVDPSDPIRRETMPHELAHGMSATGLGLRAPAAASYQMQALTQTGVNPAAAAALGGPSAGAGLVDRAARAIGSLMRGAAGAKSKAQSPAAPSPAYAPAPPPPPRGAPPPVPGRSAPGATGERERRAARPMMGIPREERADDGIVYGSVEDRLDAGLAPLRGRIVRRTRKALTVEVLIESAGFTWEPGQTAKIELADGTVRSARLGKGTRPGPIAAGASIRVVLELDAELEPSAALRGIHLDSPSGAIFIEV